MWGQEAVSGYSDLHNRIVPTRVGTRNDVVILSEYAEDHPHACGDKSETCSENHLTLGSSPRVWGQVKNERAIAPQVRIIPTRVGTSIEKIIYIVPNRDHPHACGDKPPPLLICFPLLGSSPRVWGQDLIDCQILDYCGIIPTRVGTRITNNGITTLL